MGAVLSYLPAPVQGLAEQWWDASTLLLRTLIVTGLNLATGKGEIERICGGRDQWHSPAMSQQLVRALRCSSSSSSSTLFGPKPFDSPAVLAQLAALYRIPAEERLVRENLSQCLEALNYVNAVAALAVQKKDTKFDAGKEEHKALLETLWTHLKVRESGLGWVGGFFYSLAQRLNAYTHIPTTAGDATQGGQHHGGMGRNRYVVPRFSTHPPTHPTHPRTHPPTHPRLPRQGPSHRLSRHGPVGAGAAGVLRTGEAGEGPGLVAGEPPPEEVGGWVGG